MTAARANLLTRDDTFFGVCEGLGQELGIPSNLFRLALVPLILFQPVLAVALYAALGVVVFVARVVLPVRARRARPIAAPSTPAIEQDNETLPLAA